MLTKAQAFPLPFRGEYVPRGLAEFKLFEPFHYIDEDPWESVIVPVDFITDGGSIPPVVYPIIGSPWRGPYVEATIIHDWECFLAKNAKERKKADKKFYKMLEILGVPRWKRKAMYRGVRMAAWWKYSILKKGR